VRLSHKSISQFNLDRDTRKGSAAKVISLFLTSNRACAEAGVGFAIMEMSDDVVEIRAALAV